MVCIPCTYLYQKSNIKFCIAIMHIAYIKCLHIIQMASGFVSASDLEEERKRRQEEWEKVRKPEDPITAPEPEVCNKTLYEQLRDNKEAKQAEIDEAKKFKNLIRGIDEDESDFLARVDQMKSDEMKKKRKEEDELLKEVAMARTQLIEPLSVTQIKVAPAAEMKPVKSKQASILSAAIKRKSNGDSPPNKFPRVEACASAEAVDPQPAISALKVIGSIPGMGHYDASSDSASSNSDDEEDPIIPTLQTTRPQKKCANDE